MECGKFINWNWKLKDWVVIGQNMPWKSVRVAHVAIILACGVKKGKVNVQDVWRDRISVEIWSCKRWKESAYIVWCYTWVNMGEISVWSWEVWDKNLEGACRIKWYAM